MHVNPTPLCVSVFNTAINAKTSSPTKTTDLNSSADAGETSGQKLPASSRRKAAIWFGVAAFSGALLAWLVGFTSPLQILELKTYDLRWLLRGAHAPPDDIVLVVMDEETEARFPEPRIFWHPYFANVLRAAATGGARAIGLDVAFATSVERWAPDSDRMLAAAFAEVSSQIPVVLAYDNLQAYPESLPLYILGSAQGNLGFANLTVDSDNFVRRQQLFSNDAASSESFAARLAALVSGSEWRPSRLREPLLLGQQRIPLDQSGFLRIHYWGPDGSFPAYSMAQVIESADSVQLQEWFKGKIVLIGTHDPSDRKPTPFYLAGGGHLLTPGVEIQASVLATLLSRSFVRDVPLAVTPAIVLLLASAAAWFVFRLRFPVALVPLAAVIALYFGATVVALYRGVVLPMVSPALAVMFSGLLSYGTYYHTEGRRRRLLQTVFGSYVSPELANQILEQERVPLEGTRQVVTVMFSDLRDYTTYCQGRDPQQVVSELNEYFRDMTAEIKAHGGMVNKFIGDGIMALFGAPVPGSDDAYRAIACALQMVERNREFNERRVQQGLQPLVIGIGIHTGEAVVGTIGATEKVEYTAIGDTVNVAARIEGENKTFHTQVLLSEATFELVRDRVLATPMGEAKLKGVSEAVRLYSPEKCA